MIAPESEAPAAEVTPRAQPPSMPPDSNRRPLPRQLPTIDLPDGANPELMRSLPPAQAEEGAPDVRAPEVQKSSADEAPKPSRKQRVLAFRLVPVEEKWKGRDLLAAFSAEGLRFGRYSVFHRSRDGGQTIFHAASLNEPGSFDFENMQAQLFAGASLFAVIPGPLDAETTLDIMLMTAKRLVGELGGRIQDDMGRPLTNQALLKLREELMEFEREGARLG